MKALSKFVLTLLALPKTVFFNFWHLPFKQAIRFPVLVSHRVWLKDMSGTVSLHIVRTGAVKIGFGDVAIFDQHRSRTIWQVSGSVEFMGKASLGHGSKLSVSGSLILGHRFSISAESTLIATQKITIGDNVLVSWDALISDTDFHRIYDHEGQHINQTRPITIGNGVWIGCRTLILKGVDIADGVVLAASTTLTRSIDAQNSIVGGEPARVIKENIRWQH
jgi:serine acetyltransferase